MSLEKALEANTASNIRLAEAVEAQTELLKGRLTGGAKTEAPAKEEAAEEPKKAAPKKETKKSEPKKDAAPSTEDIAKAFTDYMQGKPKGDERNARMAQCKQIIDFYEAPRATDIAEEHRARAIEMIAEFEKGETPTELASDDDGGEDDGFPI